MNANLIGSASRRRPPLFLGCRAPRRASDSLCGAAPAPRARPSSGRSALRAIGLRPLDPFAERRRRQIQSRATAPTVLPSSRTSRTAPALNSSVNRRRDRRKGLPGSHAGHRIRLSEDVHQTGSSPFRGQPRRRTSAGSIRDARRANSQPSRPSSRAPRGPRADPARQADANLKIAAARPHTRLRHTRRGSVEGRRYAWVWPCTLR